MPDKVVVVGAGWYGILAAKTYLQIDPTIVLTVLESEDTLGGTWSQGRIYPGLLAQQPVGAYEYSDRSMSPEGASKDGFIPADKIHNYLVEYATRFGVFKHVRFRTTVTKISRSENGKTWDVHISESSSNQDEVLACDKLIVATGFTSRPNEPKLSTDRFEMPVFHTKILGSKHHVVTSDNVKTVTVYGGGKSAIDAVRLCVAAGKTVNWVIRNTGSGVPALIPGTVAGKNISDVACTRFASKLHPSLNDIGDWWYEFLHSGKWRLGYRLHWWYWGVIGKRMRKYAGYEKSPNMAKLQPEVTERGNFWTNVPNAIITQHEVIDWIHEGKHITVFREDITNLVGNKVVLSNGDALVTDVLLYATGYEIAQNIFSLEDSVSFGLPTRKDQYPEELTQYWADLETKADSTVDECFPRLASPPPIRWVKHTHTPYRLYRHIVPVPLLRTRDRSLIFAGTVTAVSTAIMSEVVCLWSIAWLTDNLDIDAHPADADWDIALRNSFSRKRYLNIGARAPYVLYDWMPFVDRMLAELGLERFRKATLRQEYFETYNPRDYRGLVEEWKQMHGIVGKKLKRV